MAVKITELTALTTPASADILAIVDDPGGTPETKKISVSDLSKAIDHGLLTGLGDDDHTQYHTDARALTWLGTRSTDDLPEGAALYHTDERVDDRVSSLLQDGSGLTWTYDDGSNTLTPAVDHGGLGGLGDDDHTQYLLATGARVGASSQAQDFGSNGVKADVVGESTADAGVSIDGLLLKDGGVADDFAFSGDITPTALAAQTDDWNPTGLSTASVIRVSLTGSQDLTGIAGGADGRILILHNIDTVDALTLKDDDVGSSGSNRFFLPDSDDLVVGPESSVILWYDSTNSHWRIMGGAGTGGGGGGSGTIPLVAGAFSEPSGSGAFLSLEDSTDEVVVTGAFPTAVEENLFLHYPIPQDFGTLDAVEFVFFTDGTDTAAVRWELDMKVIAADGTVAWDDFGSPTTVASVDGTPGGAAKEVVSIEDSSLTAITLAAGDVVAFSAIRDGVTDSNTDTAHLMFVVLKYTRA